MDSLMCTEPDSSLDMLDPRDSQTRAFHSGFKSRIDFGDQRVSDGDAMIRTFFSSTFAPADPSEHTKPTHEEIRVLNQVLSLGVAIPLYTEVGAWDLLKSLVRKIELTVTYKVARIYPVVLATIDRELFPDTRAIAAACIMFIVRLDPECDMFPMCALTCEVAGVKVGYRPTLPPLSLRADPLGRLSFGRIRKASVCPTRTLSRVVMEIMSLVTSTFRWSPEELRLGDAAMILAGKMKATQTETRAIATQIASASFSTPFKDERKVLCEVMVHVMGERAVSLLKVVTPLSSPSYFDSPCKKHKKMLRKFSLCLPLAKKVRVG
jgi:hypothetical protein